MRAIVCCGIAPQLNYVNTAQLQGTLHTSRSSKRNESLAKVSGYNELKKLLARVVQDYIISVFRQQKLHFSGRAQSSKGT